MTSIGHNFARLGDELLALALRSSSSGLFAPPHAHHRQPDDEGPLALWHWIEENSSFVFPLIGVVILALVIIAVRRSSADTGEELAERRAQMDAIVRLMRARLTLTADQTASELKINRYHAAALLDELVKEGSLVAGRASGGVVSYRLKGF